MNFNDENWLSVTDAFYSAAIDGNGWYCALERLAASTGSRMGELIGLGSANTVPFNIVTGVGPEWHADFIALGGGDPQVNPFVRAGTQIPPMRVLTSAEFLTAEERRCSAFIADFAIRHDTQHICLTPLIMESNMLVGLAVMRSGRQGEISDEQRAVFTSLAPHVRAAVRMQMALEHQGAQVMAGTLEALSLAVFVCDRLGTVRAMTPAAEALVSTGGALRLKQGALHATHPAETRTLNDAIGNAAGGLARPGTPLSSTILVRDQRSAPLALEVLPLPRRKFAFGFEPRALVVVRGAQPDPNRMKGLLQMAYGLTAAEADVALRLGEGQPPEAIATARGATIGTVRVQIRSIYAKLGVHHLSELIARINQLR